MCFLSFIHIFFKVWRVTQRGERHALFDIKIQTHNTTRAVCLLQITRPLQQSSCYSLFQLYLHNYPKVITALYYNFGTSVQFMKS